MHISICGCGWLGLPLAQHLVHAGHSVTGTKRNTQAAAELSTQGITGVAFELGHARLESLPHTLFNTDVLVLNIPPGRKQFSSQHFLANMQQLIAHARQHGTKRCLFISTSAVYGESSRKVLEGSEVDPQTASAIAHVELESTVEDVFAQNGAVLRLAGLVGGARHPGKHLAGRTGLGNPHRRVNLVHRDDVIAAIEAVINLDAFGQTWHLCATEHPTRQTYYTWAANQLGLPCPTFVEEASDTPSGKILDAGHSLKTLGISLAYPSPYTML